MLKFSISSWIDIVYLKRQIIIINHFINYSGYYNNNIQ